MAKVDFCFTYYDGDAARDMAHMNRLERGCYTDLIISQRKFGAMSLDFIKKILSKDFEECWPSIEVILIKTDDDKYYIEWLQTSIEKMKSESKHQAENGKKGGRPKKANDNPNETHLKANDNPDESQKNPLEDGDGNEYVNEIIKQLNSIEDLVIPEDEQKNYVMLVVEMVKMFIDENPGYFFHKETDYPACLQIAYKIAAMKKWNRDSVLNTNKESCLQAWKKIILFIKADDWLNGRALTDLNTVKEWQRLVQKMQKQNNGTHLKPHGANGKPAGAIKSDRGFKNL
jgi:hypothetical protein